MESKEVEEKDFVDNFFDALKAMDVYAKTLGVSLQDVIIDPLERKKTENDE